MILAESRGTMPELRGRASGNGGGVDSRRARRGEGIAREGVGEGSGGGAVRATTRKATVLDVSATAE
jgi:hypothetical protein